MRSVFLETLLTAELHWNVKSRVNLDGVYMGLATLEKPLELNQKNSSVLLESSRLSF